MNVANLLRLDVTVTTRTTSATRDEMGDLVVVADPDPVTYKGYLWQENAAEDTANMAQQTETFRLALHRSAAGLVDGADQVTVAGVAYEIIGAPHNVTHPRTGAVEYLDMTVRRVR